MSIYKAAVIGSGVMGSGIAAQIANAGFPVCLLDIVPKGADKRNELAETAIDKQLKIGGFMEKEAAERITCGNLEDDLHLLGDADWIIEAVIENLDIKRDLYVRIDNVRKPGSIVTSNTSTIPLSLLTEGQSETFKQDFLITHFFNPPRHLRLLELVPGEHTRSDALQEVRDFSDIHLGKGVIVCKDTPSFIANRIGIYYLQKGLLAAFEHGVSVEEADAILGRPVGIPKTGVFGLWDLVGIDLAPHLIKSMTATLPADDPYRDIATLPDRVNQMINDGYIGRKGKGGFYRMNKAQGRKLMESMDLISGDYRAQTPARLESLKADGLRLLLEHDDQGGRYAWDVLSSLLSYSASLVPEICDDIYGVDEAMRLGYNWQYGPFELLDRLGPQWFTERLEAEGREVPELLYHVGSGSFYRVNDGQHQQFDIDGNYQEIQRPQGVVMLGDLKQGSQPLESNQGASLWDTGDGVACLEIHTKMNALDSDVFAMIRQSIDRVERDFKALVIYNDGRAFSAGANLKFLKDLVEQKQWNAISEFVRDGQQTMLALQRAPFPVIGASSGLALGGGCELLLHCNHTQAHAETQAGLVEIGVGLIPGWGGCKEMLKRWNHRVGPKKGALEAFRAIASSQISGSAHDARAMGMLHESSPITMNRDRLLANAKARALLLAPGFHKPQPTTIQCNGAEGRKQLLDELRNWIDAGQASEYDQVIANELAWILCGDETEAVDEETIMQREFDAFHRLLHKQGTLDRIEHMLNTGKTLRN